MTKQSLATSTIGLAITWWVAAVARLDAGPGGQFSPVLPPVDLGPNGGVWLSLGPPASG